MNDTERIDWMERIMTDDAAYCEIYFAGLRNFTTGKASAYQVESNPQVFPTMNRPTLREAIDAAITINR